MRRFLALALAAAISADAGAQLAPGKARPLLDSLAAAQLRFYQEWGLVWRLSEDSRGGSGSSQRRISLATARNDSTLPRNQHLHCHPNADAANRSTAAALSAFRPGRAPAFSWQTRPGSMIRSEFSMYAVCPTWIFEQIDDGDERVSIDAGLTAQFRDPVKIARLSLIGMFNAAARALPANDWIAGQLVRLLVDAQMRDSAVSAARACNGNKWWCASLTGHALAVSGRMLEADSAFSHAHRLLSPVERCRLSNHIAILDSAARKTYASLACAQRDSVNEIIWWLADPLFSVPGNERRVEQLSRAVQIALKRGLERDERYDWRERAGGDALAEMVTRYGWPTYTWWGGPNNDRSHSGYLKGFKGPLNEPYTTFEYSRQRQHLLASWDAVRDPTSAKSTDWQLNPPVESELAWWPAEHYAAKRPLWQLDEGQLAMLRRDTSIVLATSTSLETKRFTHNAGDRMDAKLVITDRPGSMRVVNEVHEPVGNALVLYGAIPSAPQVVGVEVLPDSSPVSFAARNRFGVTPLPTLAAMNPGEVAVSDPVILNAPEGDGESPLELSAVMKSMAPTTRVPASRRIAVYWETYGLSGSDTVDVAVWIERYTGQGLLRRFGNALRVTTDLNTPVAISWSEPQPGTRALVTTGRIPIVARSVVLDLSKLPRGSYWLDVAVAKPAQTPVRSRRAIVIE